MGIWGKYLSRLFAKYCNFFFSSKQFCVLYPLLNDSQLAKLKKVYFQHLPAMKFIGKKRFV